MQKYIRFGIEERLYSSNVLVGIYLNKEGKEKSDYLLSFGHRISKVEADEQIRKIANMYNTNLINILL